MGKKNSRKQKEMRRAAQSAGQKRRWDKVREEKALAELENGFLEHETAGPEQNPSPAGILDPDPNSAPLVPIKTRKPRGRIDKGKMLDLVVRRRLTQKDAAEKLGVDRPAVTRAMKSVRKLLLSQTELEHFDKCHSDIQRSAMSSLITSALEPDKLKKSSALQLLTGYGILFDKNRLENDRSTGNISMVEYFGIIRNKERQDPAVIDVTPVDKNSVKSP